MAVTAWDEVRRTYQSFTRAREYQKWVEGRKFRLLLQVGRDCTLAVISLGLRCRAGGHAWSGRLSISPSRKVLALIVLIGRSDRSKELEILVLRHELALLRRRSGRPGFEPADRALLAALSRALPRRVWAAFSVRPETLLRWHRQLVARRWTYPHRKPGRPPLARPRRELILQLARENPHWGYQRIAGELKRLGLAVSPTTVRKVLSFAGVPPAPERARQSWRSFLRQQAASTLACDFFTVETLALQRIYVLFFISLATRRLEFIACTPNPDGAWVTQQARNLVMQLGEQERRFELLIHDRDTKFSRTFDEVFRSEGIEVIRTPVRAPNANAFAERWVRTAAATASIA